MFGTDLARRKPGVQIPSPPPPNPAGQSVASLKPATLTACCGRAAAATSRHSAAGKALSDRQLGPRPHTMTTQRGRRHLPADGRSSAHPASSGRPRDRSGHCPTTDHVEADPPLAQHDLRQPRAPGSNLGQTTRRRGHGGRPCRPPAIPAVRLPARLPRCTTSFRSDTADDGRHGHRTSTPDAEAEHWTPGRSDTRTGHRSVGQARVGHCPLPPDTDADRATTAQPASGPPGPSSPSDRTLGWGCPDLTDRADGSVRLPA
jgi:hypothetical protein